MWWPTLTYSGFTLSSSPPATSPYCSSCSLACFACASTNLTRPVWDAFCGDRWALPGRCVLFPLICRSQFKGFVWLLGAIIADIPPVASGQFHVPILSTYRDISSQVLICLNLNRKFPSLPILTTKKNADDSILFYSKFQCRLMRCAFIFI